MRTCAVPLLALCVATACSDDTTRVEFFGSEGHDFSAQERDIVEDIARTSVSEVRKLLPKLPRQVTIRVQLGDDVIAETGENGTAMQPETVMWTVDPTHRGGVAAVARRWLRACLYHELHHLVRDAAVSRKSMLDMAVTEGMASAFERDFARVNVPWAQYPPEAAAWVEELRALPEGTARRAWLFHHPDGRRWIASRAGTYLVDRAMRASGESAAALVALPTARVMRLASAP